MPANAKLFLKLTAWISLLKTLGAWGVLFLAMVDSLAIPVPLDALVAGYVYLTPHLAWLYCLAGAAGSAAGCLGPYALGRIGGELFLLKRMDEARLRAIRDRFERREFVALMVPAMLPPPTPFKLFVFSAGVFEMRIPLFLLAIFSGRIVRFALLSVLTIRFGPHVVSETKLLLGNHIRFATLAAVVILGALVLIVRLMRTPAAEVAREIEGQHNKA